MYVSVHLVVRLAYVCLHMICGCTHAVDGSMPVARRRGEVQRP